MVRDKKQAQPQFLRFFRFLVGMVVGLPFQLQVKPSSSNIDRRIQKGKRPQPGKGKPNGPRTDLLLLEGAGFCFFPQASLRVDPLFYLLTPHVPILGKWQANSLVAGFDQSTRWEMRLLWMDEILRHFETMVEAIACWHMLLKIIPLGFLGGAGFRPSTVC